MMAWIPDSSTFFQSSMQPAGEHLAQAATPLLQSLVLGQMKSRWNPEIKFRVFNDIGQCAVTESGEEVCKS